MSEAIHLKFDAAPNLFPLYRRIFLARRPGLKKGASLPEMSAQWKGAKVDAANVTAYCKACGIDESAYLPMLYPYVLTARLQVSLFANNAFPLTPMGMVHRGQHVLQRRNIGLDESLDASVKIGPSRVAKSGLEFDVYTHITSGDEPVWESVSSYWVRGKYGQAQESPAFPQLAPFDEGAELTQQEWSVAKGMGRHYAGVSKDFNPIHVSSILAKLFGFRKAIIHGMWSAARCLSVLPDLAEAGPVRADFLFKGPIFLGKNVSLQHKDEENSSRFDLYCQGNKRPCLNGYYGRVAAEDKLV